MFQRKTKIVATLGPATDSPLVLKSLLAAGVDCVRLNCSHSTIDELRSRAEEARQVATEAWRPLPLLVDLQGPKIRLGDTITRRAEVGEELEFGPNAEISVPYDGFIQLVNPQSELVIGDGTPRLEVTDIRPDRVRARVRSAGVISAHKGINITLSADHRPALTTKDYQDIDLACAIEAEFIALSFVRSAADIRALRAELEKRNSQARIIAKIEKPEAFDAIDKILEVADGVMVARGDYGVEAGHAAVPAMQKRVIAKAIAAGKLAITATQMMESMLTSPEPTRAEVSDIYNAVLDGTSALMLSAETSVGQHPVEAVAQMNEIAATAEQTGAIRAAKGPSDDEREDEALMRAAIALARDTQAAAIVVPTATGRTPRACARYRTEVPIIALTHDPMVCRQLQLEWGVYPTAIAVGHSTEELLSICEDAAERFARLPHGSTIVLTAGPSAGRTGATNLITLRHVGQRYE